MKGKLILVEGTDSSGKQTQVELLAKRLTEDGYDILTLSFPDYNSPTGKIVGGPYLGKPEISEGYFEEGAVNVDPRVAGHYYAADRLAKKDMLVQHLNKGGIVLLDRYVESNMAHQGSKFNNKKERLDFYNWCINMEYKNNGLPLPYLTVFLHMPYEAAVELKKNRVLLDQHENDEEHLKKAEKVYIELSELYGWLTVECLKTKEYQGISSIKEINNINDDIYKNVQPFLTQKKVIR